MTHLLLRRCCAPNSAAVPRPHRRRSNPPLNAKICRRRTLILLSISPLPTFIPIPNHLNPSSPPAAAQPSPGDLVPYADREAGFAMPVPSSWMKVEKAGATALFEEEGKGSNNIGVVVNPVRLASLRDFGSPEFVAEKLIQAEKRKESTKAAEVIKVGERSNHEGIPVYEFEYLVDSTRGGMKRIFSAAFVTSKKLYLLNISHSDRPESPLDNHTRFVLETVLHSFDTVV
ncbi:hypothetical protein J5N97_021136 [Dioscorea zingiberensis]|uniref:PsbP C-terminal domain-containing protein n=1 Tax=Dioscorea zingiberensis TaxID=325984 RepID=A0A9D5CH31_9LILI|nr:hypothetical protein J5N97_021136 [Dioscorea zingiberensis]